MGLFDKIFKKKTIVAAEPKKYLSEAEIVQRNKEFTDMAVRLKELFKLSLSMYNTESCQCAYPRYQQIIGIDCSDTGNSFKCYDTDILINLSKSYFDIEGSELTDECTNEKWVCKTCGSTYDYGWSDFSIYVDRQKLKLRDLKVGLTGKAAIKPIPLYLGLMGHSYPSSSEIASVDFDTFQNYMTEK
jgi:hypothetical protein